MTASAQLRTVTCALLRRYGTTVESDFAAAIRTAAASGRGSHAGERFEAAVVDLDLLPVAESPSGGCGEDGLIEQLRAALWGEGVPGVVIGIAPAAHTSAALGKEEQHWELVKGINAVLER